MSNQEIAEIVRYIAMGHGIIGIILGVVTLVRLERSWARANALKEAEETIREKERSASE